MIHEPRLVNFQHHTEENILLERPRNFLVLRAVITTLCSRSLREAFLTESSLPMQPLETACVAQCGVGFSVWNLKNEMH